MKCPDYNPTPLDILWAKSMVNMIRDGGILAYPATHLIYRLNHQRKLLILKNPKQLTKDIDSFITHCRSIKVFKRIGWTVKPGERELDIEGS